MLAVLACVVTRLPAGRYVVISDDEAIYAAIARVLSSGGVMYRDAVDHKPPGLAYSYAAVRDLVGGATAPAASVMDAVHVLGMLVVVATCLALAAIARRLFPDPRAAGWAALAYALMSAIKKPVDGLAVNGELMMNLPTAFALLAALIASARRGAARVVFDLLCGALIALAVLYKYQGLAVATALPVLWALRAPAGDRRWHSIGAGALATFSGAVIVGAVVAGYFAAHHALSELVFWGLMFNRRYVAEGPGMAAAFSRLSLQLLGVVLPGLLIYAAGYLGVRRILRSTMGPASALVPWSAAALVCVSLGGRYFGHYFVQLELPLSLAAAPILVEWFDLAPRRVALACAAPALAFFAIAMAPSVSRRYLNADDPDYDAIGRAAASLTTRDETIWVWGNVPQIYEIANRRMGVRFSFCNYLTGLSPGGPSEDDPRVDTRKYELPEAWAMVSADLAAHAPALIVDTAAAGAKSYEKYPVRDYPVLATALATRYRVAGRVNGAVLWRRID